MRTIKNEQKNIHKLRKQLLSLQAKQQGIRKKLRLALQKVGKNAGKSVRHIDAVRLRKRT